MTRILILFTIPFLSLLSCQDRKPVKQNQNNTITTTNPNKEQVPPTWQTVNDDLEKKYQSRIEFKDIERVYNLLLHEKLIDKNALIDESYYPTFTHLSPTVMLGDVTIGSRSSDTPEEMKVFTYIDTDFIMSQQSLRSTKEFKWSSITDNIASADTYPKLEIGIPVFSIDKKKCIIQIREFKSEDCVNLISYLFVTTASETKYYVFEKVTSC